MESLVDPEEERQRILDAIRELAAAVERAVSQDVDDLAQGVRMLSDLRKASHEETNQLQHEALLLEAAAELAMESEGREIRWSWNPRQTGPLDEPDLQGEVDGEVVVSLEATASHVPLDSRIKHTLQKLSRLPGRRVYCVRTPQMQRRALTKVAKARYDIEVRLISDEPPGDAGP